MNHFITYEGLREIEKNGRFFKEIASVNVNTYCYLISRVMEVAMKGENSVKIPAEGLEGLQGVLDSINQANQNTPHMGFNEEDNTVEMSW
ncbi:MAG: hypothetical protein E6772_16030 [Dysgonomonas sp.]|nr:hypothetical protein [Dysgonomonas sp.]